MKMQKTKYRVVLCFLLIIASICVVGCGKKKNNSKENSDNKKLTEHQEAWIKDLDGTFRETLAKSAGVTENMTDDERNQRIDEIIDNIKTKDLNDDEVVYSIRKLISDFKIAHMDFTRSDEYC